MQTVQPLWRFVASLGDISPIDYGGAILYRDIRGNYCPEVEVIEVVEDSQGVEVVAWNISRILVEPCTFENGILSDNPYHADCAAWFADSLGAIAESIDRPLDSLISDLCGADIVKAAAVYLDIAWYHGIDNFDSYPLTFSRRSDMRRRYRSLKSRGLRV